MTFLGDILFRQVIAREVTHLELLGGENVSNNLGHNHRSNR